MYLLARVLMTSNQPKESLGLLTQAAAIATPSSEDLRTAALDYVLLEDYTDAVHWLTRSVEMNPKNAEAWYDLARAKMMQNKYAEAQQAIEKALLLNPQSVKAENNLGLILEAQNRTDEAADAYRHAIEWQKNAPHPSEQPLLNYGTLLIDKQRSEEAVPLLEQAVQIAPKDPKCHEQLARALERQGQLKDAITEMQAAIQLDPRNPRLHFQLGQIYRRADQADKEREEMELSKKLYGEHSSEPVPQ
jgi:Flp pilus assembly protein TadD